LLPAWARDVYSWSHNVAIAPFDGSRQQGETRHDQPNVHLGRDGSVYLVGLNIRTPPSPRCALLFARSTDGGKTCLGQRRLIGVGQLPQILGQPTRPADRRIGGILHVGGSGRVFLSKSAARIRRQADAARAPTGARSMRSATSTAGGLHIQASADGGKNWRVTRVDDAARATASRYPAIHMDRRGRVHVAPPAPPVAPPSPAHP
jgi:hypothetical protein